MIAVSSCLVSIFLALSAAATPVVQVREPSVSVSLLRGFNVSGSTLPEIDRSRAAELKSRSGSQSKRDGSFPVTNTAVTYVASVGVGTPATYYSLLVDTGSSNTWVGANTPYVSTSSSVNTGDVVEVTYGSGAFGGSEYLDTVTLSSNLVIQKQSIGVAAFAVGFSGVDGILGIGPTDLTDGTVSNEGAIPTVTDNLFAQGSISQKVVGAYYAPTTTEGNPNGELTFGAVDTSKIVTPVNYVPITAVYPASAYFGIDQSITYGAAAGSPVLASTAGIVDTGTTLLLIASDAFANYVSLTGAVTDPVTGLLTISTVDYANLKSLYLDIGGTSYEFTANAQTWPRSLNTAIGGSASAIYLVVADLGSTSGQGLDFIDGYVFLERYYSVYDTTNNRVGFAATADTYSTVN